MKRVQVTMTIPEVLHDQLKQLGLLAGRTKTYWVEKALWAYVREQQAKLLEKK